MAADPGSTNTATTVMQNLEAGLKGAANFASNLYYLVGMALCISAIYTLKKFGHRTAFMHVQVGVIGPMVQFFIGVALIYSPTLFKIINQTLFETPVTSSEFSGFAQAASTQFRLVYIIREISAIIQLIGIFAFLRGWLILTKVGKQGTQPGTVTKGIVHLIGGILAINIITTVNIVVATLGLGQ